MRFDLKRPCADCPFRTDIQPYLDLDRMLDITADLLERDKTFSCHKTVDYKRSFKGRVKKDSQHCAGAMIFLQRQGKPNTAMQLAARLPKIFPNFPTPFDPGQLDTDAPVFSSLEEIQASFNP